MVRIRYTKQDDKLISKDLVGNGDLLKVVIDKVNGSFKLMNSRGTTLRMGEGYSSLAKTKKEAKKVMIEFGVVFEDEVRKSRKGDTNESATMLNN